jgi:hypothetical protein
MNCNDLTFTTEPDADRATLSPEFKLMLAVLEDALVTFQYGLRSDDPQERRYGFEVEHWISSRESDSPFAFESICGALHLDPECIRQGLAKLKRTLFVENAGRRRIRLRRGNAEGTRTPHGTIATDTNETRRRKRAASDKRSMRTSASQAAAGIVALCAKAEDQ